jgi:hypothetical protein
MAGDLNAKHWDWNWKFTTGLAPAWLCQQKLLLDLCAWIPNNDSLATQCDPRCSNVAVKDFVPPVHLIICSELVPDHSPVLIDTTCKTFLQNQLSHPVFERMDSPACQAFLEDRLLGNPAVNDEEALDKCIEVLTRVTQEALAASALKTRPRGDPRPG